MSTVLLLLLMLMIVNGLSIDGQSSGDDALDSVQSRLMKLEQTMTKLQLENGAIKEELSKAKQSNTDMISNYSQLEITLTLLQDSIKDLQDINVTNHLKLLLLRDELRTSKNELSELRALVSLLRKDTVMITAQFVDTKHNITLLQQSIKQLLENTAFLMDRSSTDGAKLAEITRLVSTLQSLIVTMESSHLQFESLVSANNSWLSERIDGLDQKLDTSTDQLMKKNRKQDKQLKKMIVQVTDLKQQVDELSVNDTVVIATSMSVCIL